MYVTFYQFSKRENSTKRPSGGTVYNVTLKEPSSVTAPVISLVWTGAGSPALLNYAHIPAFTRYYFIRNWVFADRQWTAELVVDPLASWKTYIGVCEKYVLRSYSKFNTDVLDTTYPAKAGILTSDRPYNMDLGNSYGTGCYIVGIVSISGDATLGGIDYYALSSLQLSTLIKEVYNNALSLFTITPASVEEAIVEVGKILQKTALRPFDFIQSVKWSPYSFTGDGAPVKVGYYTTSITAKKLTSSSGVFTKIVNLSYDTPSPGDMLWKTIAPYRWYSVDFAPFGSFMLDAARVQAPGGDLYADMYIDAISGQGRLHIYKATASPFTIWDTLADITTQVCMPVSIANNSVNYLNLAQDVAGAAVSFGRMAGGDESAAVSLIGNIANAADHLFPAPVVKGNTAGAIMGDGQLHFHEYNLTPVDEDQEENGRPLCEMTVLNTLSGYILCSDGDVPAPASLAELSQIKSYLEGGFFYE